MKNQLLALALLAALSTAAAAHDQRPARYFAYEIPAPEFTDPLCVAGFATSQFGTDLNNRRFLAGGAGCYHQDGVDAEGQPFYQRHYQPYAWSPATGSYLLPRNGDGDALPLGVDIFNNAYGFHGGNGLDGVKWPPGGGLELIFGADPACGFGISIALRANARGEAIGWAFRPAPEGFCNIRWVLRKPDGTELIGPVGGSPAAINGAGLVAGNINNRAAKWNSRSGEVTFLRPETDTDFTGVLDMNERGVAVGSASVLESNGPPVCRTVTPIVWDARNRERALPKLPGSVSSNTYGINEDGDIVGDATPSVCNDGATEMQRAVIWTGGRVADLNRQLVGRPGIVLLSTSAINDRGEIMAFGHRAWEPEKPCPQTLTPPGGGLPTSDDSTCHDTRAYLLIPID